MAAKAGEPQSPSAVRFMRMVASALGVDVDTEEGVRVIAEKAGLDPRYVYRWRSGKHALSLRYAVQVLERSNLLRSAAEAVGEPESPQLALERLVASVAELTKSHREALDDLQDVRTRLARAEEALAPAQAVPKRSNKR